MKKLALVSSLVLAAACGSASSGTSGPTGTTGTTGSTGPLTWTGTAAASITLPSGTDLHPDSGKTPEARPQGIVSVGGKVYAVLTNLAKDTMGYFSVSGGPGLVAIIDPSTNTVTKTVALGSCRNPALARVDGTTLLIPCSGDYSGSLLGGAGLAIYDTTTDTATVIDTGASPASVARAGNEIFVGDGASGGLLRINATTHAVQNGRGGEAAITACASNSMGYAYVPDLVDTGSELLIACFNTNEIVVADRTTGVPTGVKAAVSDGPLALAWDGTTAWSAATLANVIDAVTPGATMLTAVKKAIDLTGGGTAKSSPQQVVVDSAGDLYSVDSGTDDVVKLDPAGKKVLAAVHLDSGSDPYNLAVLSPDVVYVTQLVADKVARLEFHGK